MNKHSTVIVGETGFDEIDSLFKNFQKINSGVVPDIDQPEHKVPLVAWSDFRLLVGPVDQGENIANHRSIGSRIVWTQYRTSSLNTVYPTLVR